MVRGYRGRLSVKCLSTVGRSPRSSHSAVNVIVASEKQSLSLATSKLISSVRQDEIDCAVPGSRRQLMPR